MDLEGAFLDLEGALLHSLPKSEGAMASLAPLVPASLPFSSAEAPQKTHDCMYCALLARMSFIP